MTAQIFRTPEQVAPELGMKPTELRRYVRESGICTRLSKNRIMFHDDDVTRLVAWVRERNAPTPEQKEIDPFA
ncbi:excise [Arthrobacter phage Shoya]|uniref:Excise n=1 Tax=Arthrobacter phage Shoya TaxID=2704035 RepID=A0A6G6XHY0_9CAUD|nr:excise [Arthrobacter phage Shoya]QIG57712.1 excise [Arthrobacter phage Shoya]